MFNSSSIAELCSMWVIALIISLFFSFADEEPDFTQSQLENQRVRQALLENNQWINHLLDLNQISTDSFDVLIRAFKFEEDVELWAKNRDSSAFKLITQYKFCSNVGSLGPKRRQGDLQIPEGIYTLSKFNPNSNYHLSLKVDYPNKADSINGSSFDLGGMIFIHGGCNTIGCIPITDEKIKELYSLAFLAKSSGQAEIPIHIYPARLHSENMNLLERAGPSDELRDFWRSLALGYQLFEQNHSVPSMQITSDGQYRFFQN